MENQMISRSFTYRDNGDSYVGQNGRMGKNMVKEHGLHPRSSNEMLSLWGKQEREMTWSMEHGYA